MKFNIVTFGCKVNQYESNMMKEKMLSSNFFYEENMSDANIIIVNTCSVTNVADKKCLKMIRKIKREYPNALLVVAGCSSQNNQNVYEALDIDILLGNKDKSKIAELIKEYLDTEKKYVKFYNERNLDFEDMLINDYNHVRAFVKIEDGCDNFCSYCIVPYVRGRERSRNPEDILNEVKSLAKQGYKEITLLGQNVNSYLKSGNVDFESDVKSFADLLREVNKIQGIERIRFVSPHPKDFTDDVIEAIRDCDKVCKIIHLPLQSGSTKVLKAMNRKYTKEQYVKLAKKMKEIIPEIVFSTDIIVGFPGETEEDFLETLDVVDKVGYSTAFTFIYSKRTGTPAAVM